MERSETLYSDPALLAEACAALAEIGKLIDLIDCADKHNLALLPLFLAEQKRALAALARMEQSDPATARYIRAGKLLHDKAKSHGWLDDGEGAYEFMSRLTYAQGMEDAKGIRADALEEAAQMAENYRKTTPVADVIAEDIRALKEQP